MNEVNKELKPEPVKQKFRVWEKGVEDLPNVTYFKLINSIYDNEKEVGLIIVDYLGNEVYYGNVLVIRENGKLDLSLGVNGDFGLNLDRYNRLNLL